MRSYWRGDQAGRQIAMEMDKRLGAAALAVAQEARESMMRPKHGRMPPNGARLYSGRASGGGKPQFRIPGWGTRRSAPGEPPAVQTGRLYRSITTERPKLLVRLVGTNVNYGRHLEEGTERILPRPWLKPALQASIDRTRQILAGR